MTFTSKPGKIYEVQGSPDLAVFSPLTDVVGASVVAQTTVLEPSVGEDQYFFRIQEKLDAPNATWLARQRRAIPPRWSPGRSRHERSRAIGRHR